MSYIDQQKALKIVSEKLPPQVLAVLPDTDIEFMLEEICGTFELTMGEVGEICELVRQIITKEQPPEGFEARLKEKLDEDNQPKTEDIVSALSEKIFSKLLPALGIKVPLEMAIKPKMPVVEQKIPAQTAPQVAPSIEPPIITPIKKPTPTPEPPKPVQLRRMAPPPVPKNIPAKPEPSTPQPPKIIQEPAKVPDILTQNKPKPPIIETSHESMSDQPLESLMKMLEGVVTEKALTRQFEKLPYSLKNALRSVDSAKKVVDIGRKYAIHVDKLGEIGAETGMVLLGFSHPNQFLNRLSRHLDLPEDKIRAIAQEINTEVFLKVREALKEMNGEGVKMQPPAPKPAEAPIPPKPAVQKLTPKPIPDNLPTGEVNNLEPEASLTKEDILQGIEHPTPTQFETESDGMNVAQNTNKADTVASEPPKPKTNTNENLIASKESTAQIMPTENKNPISNQEPLPQEKPAIQQEPKAQERPKSIIDQKLSSTTTSIKSESKYSEDPYREPIE